MSFDSDAVQKLFDLAQSKALATGYFDAVNTVEPKAPPGNDVTCALWVNSIQPVRTSGLALTSILVILNARIYSNMLQDPQDSIDPNMLTAACALFNAYSNDFELIDPQTGLPTVREVDLLGAYGPGLSMQAGYLTVSGQLNRIMTVTIPVVVNDAFSQVALRWRLASASPVRYSTAVPKSKLILP